MLKPNAQLLHSRVSGWAKALRPRRSWRIALAASTVAFAGAAARNTQNPRLLSQTTTPIAAALEQAGGMGGGSGQRCGREGEATSREAVRERMAATPDASTSRPGALPEVVVDAICGVMGEAVQLLALYPLDTLKVRCQVSNSSLATVVAQLASGRHGHPLQVLRSLYAGALPMAAFSGVIGCTYYTLFCAIRRLTVRCGRGDAIVPASHASQAGSSAGRDRAADSQPSGADPETARLRSYGLVAGLLAAAGSSLGTSIIEGPIETFRHRVQAGIGRGSMLSQMASTMKSGGNLYAWYLPFLFKSLPYDMAELVTYSVLSDWRASGAQPSSEPAVGGRERRWGGSIAAHLQQEQVVDAMIGVAAGVAAVLASAPADYIKTRLETSPIAAGAARRVTAAQFLHVLKGVWVEGGWRSLSIGLAPRLVEVVPSTMLYWMTVEALRRHLSRVRLPERMQQKLHTTSLAASTQLA